MQTGLQPDTTIREGLSTIAALSHEFGQPRYVHGGGGNTSMKDRDWLWVKPSGLTLAEMKPTGFVQVSRKGIDLLFQADLPAEARAREAAVKDLLTAAVAPDSHGRPSVEAPLHHVLPGRFVVHTHPALVNGLTCARDGEAACARLLPMALWVEYVDPGFTLCAQVRQRIDAVARYTGSAPRCVVLQNHGIFVGGDTADEIRAVYADVMGRLEAVYRERRIAMTLPEAPARKAQAAANVLRQVREVCGAEWAGAVVDGGSLALFQGPLTPDHVVYAGAQACANGCAPEALRDFRTQHGQCPRVLADGGAVYGVGSTPAAAALALTFARDAALVEQLSAAFGGPRYMDERARRFIETWEVESYRRSVATGTAC